MNRTIRVHARGAAGITPRDPARQTRRRGPASMAAAASRDARRAAAAVRTTEQKQ